MDDRFRVSDADWDRATVLLRGHFAAGRLSAEELEERLAAALDATTAGDLRRVLADHRRPVSPVWPRPRDLTAQDRHLMPKHQFSASLAASVRARSTSHPKTRTMNK